MKDIEGYKKVEIEAATVAQAKQFAEAFLNLEAEAKDKLPEIIAKLRAANWLMPFILVPTTVKVDGAPQAAGMQIRPHSDGVRNEVKIRIYSNDKPGGTDPVPVGVNGSVMLIPRDKDVWVPEEYMRVLQNAIEVSWPEYDGEKDMIGGLHDDQRRMVLSVPFTLA